MERIEKGSRGVSDDVAAARARILIGAFPEELSAQGNRVSGRKNCIGRHGLEKNGVVQDGRGAILSARLVPQVDPAVRSRRDGDFIALGRKPASSIKSGKRDSPPSQARVAHRFAGANAHDYFGVFLDLADLTELDVVREAGH